MQALKNQSNGHDAIIKPGAGWLLELPKPKSRNFAIYRLDISKPKVLLKILAQPKRVGIT